MSEIKVCATCKEAKTTLDYYSNVTESWRSHPNCKECCKKKNRENYRKRKEADPDFLKRERERSALYYATKSKTGRKNNMGNPFTQPEILIRYYKRYPEKQAAHMAVRKLKRIKGSHFHHWSYNEEHYIDVIPLLVKDHELVHKFIVFDANRLKYRRKDNYVLLNTREEHEAFIREVLNK